MTRPTHYRHAIPAHVMLQRAHRPLTEEEKGISFFNKLRKAFSKFTTNNAGFLVRGFRPDVVSVVGPTSV